MRLSDAEFWALTPRQFHLLWNRHRENLLHIELCHAYTTAAVINWSQWAPEERVDETRYMPNYRDQSIEPEPDAPPIDADELSTYRASVANIAALMQKYAATGIADPQLVALGVVAAHG